MGSQDGIDSILDWPTLSEETELLSEEMSSYLRSNPVAYAGHRILANFVQADGRHGTKEYNEVPFLGRSVFPLAITGYWLYRRARHLGRLDTSPQRFDGHLFVMHSTRHDKRLTLASVAKRLVDQEHEVLLLCSPETEDYRAGWESDGLRTTTFSEIVGMISTRRWLACFRTARRLLTGLRTRAPESFAAAPTAIVFNFLFLEAIKAEALSLISARPTIHTYAPMGYVLEATDFDRVFGYQHGIMYGQEADTGHQEYRRGYPFFAPINYLTWGEAWHEKFRYSTHPDTELHPTGSPWHEFLTHYTADIDTEYDVLFLSSAGRQTSEGEAVFEEFVQSLIETCERRGWRLGIKLHPKEAGDWYVERGWSGYVIEPQPEIQEALAMALVAITTGSSTLAESVVIGTPICKWFDQLSPLERNGDLDLVFDITPDTIDGTLDAAMGAGDHSGEATELLNSNGAIDRIVATVTDEESE